jgi:hypothetical protein
MGMWRTMQSLSKRASRDIRHPCRLSISLPALALRFQRPSNVVSKSSLNHISAPFLVTNERNGSYLSSLSKRDLSQRDLNQLPLTASLSSPQLPQRSSRTGSSQMAFCFGKCFNPLFRYLLDRKPYQSMPIASIEHDQESIS